VDALVRTQMSLTKGDPLPSCYVGYGVRRQLLTPSTSPQDPRRGLGATPTRSARADPAERDPHNATHDELGGTIPKLGEGAPVWLSERRMGSGVTDGVTSIRYPKERPSGA
jgi:hypothetical protein